MTLTEVFEKIANFRFPANAAFAYIYLSTKQDADNMESALISANFRTIQYFKGGEYEIVFWPSHRKPFMEKERKQKNIVND